MKPEPTEQIRPWPQMEPMPSGHDLYYTWHHAINAFSGTKIGSGEFPTFMYSAKAAAQEVPRLALLFNHERLGKLPKVFRSCACCSDQKHVVDNHLTCCLGQQCRACPYLLALDTTKTDAVTIDWIKAWTCVSHILSEGGDTAGEGFITTVDDRMYWDGVYSSLAGGGE